MDQTKSNLIQLSFYESKQLTEGIDEAAGALTKEVREVEKYTILINETPTYEVFNDLLEGIASDLDVTRNLWEQTTYKNLLSSVSSLQFFCTKYKNDYPILKKMLLNASDPRVKKEKILKYFDRIKTALKRCKEKFDTATPSLEKFTTSVGNNQDKLKEKVIPNIRKSYKGKKIEYDNSVSRLELLKKNILAQDALYDEFLRSSVGIAVGIAITPVVHFGLKGLGKLAAKSGISVVRNIGGKVAAKLGGKFFAGITIAITVAEIAGLIATSVKAGQHYREGLKLRKDELELDKEIAELDTSMHQLTKMQTGFESVVDQGSTVNTVFKSLAKAWTTAQTTLENLESQTKDMDAEIEEDMDYIEGTLETFEDEFKMLSGKLKNYELGFQVPVEINEAEIDLDKLEELDLEKNFAASSSPQLFIPRKLYNAYYQIVR